MSSLTDIVSTKQSPFPLAQVSIELVNNAIYVFGITGCYTIEIDKLQTWTKFSGMGLAPKDREQGSATVTGTRLFLFGGKDKNQQAIDDFSMLNTEYKAWAKPKPQGTAPTARFGHSATKNGNQVHIFGGMTKSAVSNELFIFDSGKLTWELISTKDPPTPRHSHSAVFANSQLIVCGGYDGVYMSDFYSFDFGTRAWLKLKINGTQIPPRANHAMVLVSNKIYIFGGNSSSGILNDGYVIDVGTYQCQKISNYSLAVKGHAAIASPNGNKVYLFGGSGSNGPLKEDEAVVSISLDRIEFEQDSKPIQEQEKVIDKRKSLGPSSFSSAQPASATQPAVAASSTTPTTTSAPTDGQGWRKSATPSSPSLSASSSSTSPQAYLERRKSTRSLTEETTAPTQAPTAPTPSPTAPTPSPATPPAPSPASPPTQSLQYSASSDKRKSVIQQSTPSDTSSSVSPSPRSSIYNPQPSPRDSPPSDNRKSISTAPVVVEQPTKDPPSSDNLKSVTEQLVPDSQPARDAPSRDYRKSAYLSTNLQFSTDSQAPKDTPPASRDNRKSTILPADVSQPPKDPPSWQDNRKSIPPPTTTPPHSQPALSSKSSYSPSSNLDTSDKALLAEIDSLKSQLENAHLKIEQLERKITVLEQAKLGVPTSGGPPPAPPPPPPPSLMKKKPAKPVGGISLADALLGATLKPADQSVGHAAKDTKESAKSNNASSLALLAISQRKLLRSTSAKTMAEKRPEKPQETNPIQTMRGGLRKGNVRNQPAKR